jgi:FkbM family methyltransferase
MRVTPLAVYPTFMLITRLVQTLFSDRRAARVPGAVDSGPAAQRVQSLAGFNKLVKGRHGWFLANENDVYVGRALIEYGEYGEIESQLLLEYCKPGDVVVEVGANIGSHSVGLATRVGPHGRLAAIEPQPVIFQTLCANLALNCLVNVDAFNCGCGDTASALEFAPADYADTGNFGGVELHERGTVAGGIPVEVKALDDLLMPYARVDLIKIDVEGMEQQVLESGRRTIARFSPVLYVENDRIEKSKALIETLDALGYRAWWHIPALFNPNNYFGNPVNRYSNIGSFNMLCLPRSAPAPTSSQLIPIKDADYHPLRRPNT